MDFGDILDQWDRQTGKACRPVPPREDIRQNKPDPQPLPQRVDPLTAWLRINGVPDKDAEAEDTLLPPGERRRRRLAQRPDAVIDLHGLTRDEAWAALEIFFRAGQQQGFEKLLIVHGKGNHSEGEGVLKRIVRNFIEQCPFAGESGQSPIANGGTGSTWVLLKG